MAEMCKLGYWLGEDCTCETRCDRKEPEQLSLLPQTTSRPCDNVAARQNPPWHPLELADPPEDGWRDERGPK